MATLAKIGEQISVGTTPVEYQIDESLILMNQPFQTLTVRTASGNAGTIKFAIGVTPPAAQEAVPANQTFTLHGLQNGFRNVWAVGSAPAQLFTLM